MAQIWLQEGRSTRHRSFHQSVLQARHLLPFFVFSESRATRNHLPDGSPTERKMFPNSAAVKTAAFTPVRTSCRDSGSTVAKV